MERQKQRKFNPAMAANAPQSIVGRFYFVRSGEGELQPIFLLDH
jgi:hypothetical protein